MILLKNENLIDEITRRIGFNKNSKKIKETLSIINEQNKIIEQFDGNWFLFDFIDHKKNKPTYILCSYFIGENEIIEQIEAYINVFYFKESSIKGDILSEVLNEIEDMVQDDVNWIYLEISEDMSQLIQRNQTGWILVTSIVEKRIQKLTSIVIPSGIRIRNANDMDIENVLNCLTKAHILGLPKSMDKSSSAALIKNRVIDYYSPLIKKNRLVFVCEKDGEFCGHASFELDTSESEPIEKQASIIDIFTIDKYQNLGLGKLLYQYGENKCKELGIDRLIGTVESNSRESILPNLRQTGWIVKTNVFGKNNK